MLTSSILSIALQACIGDWSYLPVTYTPDSGDAALLLSVRASNAFELKLPDGNFVGPGQRQADGSVSLHGQSAQVFTLTDCGVESASLRFPDGHVVRVVRPPENFWELAAQKGWEAERDVAEVRDMPAAAAASTINQIQQIAPISVDEWLPLIIASSRDDIALQNLSTRQMNLATTLLQSGDTISGLRTAIIGGTLNKYVMHRSPRSGAANVNAQEASIQWQRSIIAAGVSLEILDESGQNLQLALGETPAANIFSTSPSSAPRLVSASGSGPVNVPTPQRENCIDWARGPTVSEDRRLIDIFSNPALTGSVYNTFNRDNPPIDSPASVQSTIIGGLQYRDRSYIYKLFDVPKNEFETTAQYLDRRRSFWSRLLGESGHVVHIGHRRLSFGYDADAQTMMVNSVFDERLLVIGDGPRGLRFSNNHVQQGRDTVFNAYYVQTSRDLFARMETDRVSPYSDYRPIVIRMDGEAARDVDASGFLKLKIRLPIFRSPEQPTAMRESTFVERVRAAGHTNSIHSDLQCAVLVTAGGRYYDLLSVQ